MRATSLLALLTLALGACDDTDTGAIVAGDALGADAAADVGVDVVPDTPGTPDIEVPDTDHLRPAPGELFGAHCPEMGDVAALPLCRDSSDCGADEVCAPMAQTAGAVDPFATICGDEDCARCVPVPMPAWCYCGLRGGRGGVCGDLECLDTATDDGAYSLVCTPCGELGASCCDDGAPCRDGLACRDDGVCQP